VRSETQETRKEEARRCEAQERRVRSKVNSHEACNLPRVPQATNARTAVLA